MVFFILLCDDMNIDKATKIFKFFGLTEYQSRVLFALLKKKSCSISNIAKISGVPNTRIYDILKQLKEMEFVIQISEKPKLYRVRNVDLVLDHLYDKKTREFEVISKEVNEMKSFFKDENLEENNSLVSVNKELDFVKLLNEELSKANNSIIGFSSNEIENKNIVDSLNKAINKKIDVKLLLKPELNSSFDSKDNVKIKNHSLSAYIIDNKKVIMKLSNEEEQIYKMGILNNHNGIKKMLNNYFYSNWNNDDNSDDTKIREI